MEKLVLALVLTSRKLMHYFQTHSIVVYTEFPLKNILSKVDLSSRLLKWVVELGQSNNKFLPRATIKGQVPADFDAEFLSRVVSPRQENLLSAHRREESSGAKPAETQPDETQSAHKNHETIKKPSTIPRESNIDKIIEVPEVIIEPP